MFCNYRLAIAALVAASALTCGSAQAQVKPFKISGSGVAPTGLPLPHEGPGDHTIDDGHATHLGRYTGDGSVDTEDPVPGAPGTLVGKFGSGRPYVFTAANGDQLVCVYGRGPDGEAEGDFTLFIQGVTDDGQLIVTSTFVAEFVVQPELSTGKFAGVTGSWTMFAFADAFVLGSDDPLPYWWEGEGELTFPKN